MKPWTEARNNKYMKSHSKLTYQLSVLYIRIRGSGGQLNQQNGMENANQEVTYVG